MDRFTGWIGVAVLALVVAAVVLSRSPAIPPPETSDPTSPEGVTRAWLVAIDDGRPEDAWLLLAPRTQARETRDDFLRRMTRTGGNRSARAAISGSRITGDEAVVEVSRSRTPSLDPFFFWTSGASTDRVVARLERIGGLWRLTVPPGD
ncbi:MAG: hypothetical protein EXR45_00025 [Chloroflexi bacterium]|nr:hypothetical protein [Chloroflexota bacterium]